MMEEDGLLRKDETAIMKAALKLQEVIVEDIYTPLDDVYMLEINQKIDNALMRDIYEKGYSRIPIYKNERENIVGFLLARDLVLLNTEKRSLTLRQLSSILFEEAVIIPHNDEIEKIFGFFKKGLTHIAVVSKVFQEDLRKDPVRKVIGIITMEDIIEAIIDDEIEDEKNMTAQ